MDGRTEGRKDVRTDGSVIISLRNFVVERIIISVVKIFLKYMLYRCALKASFFTN
jgi:hypothetical protein